MAKVSAHGSKLFQVAKLWTVIDNSTEIERKTTIALMEDRVVLEKYQSKRDGQPFVNDSWKIRGKLKPDVTPQQWLANKLKLGFVQE